MEQIPVSSSPVKRGENLTDEQRQYLIEKIEAYKDPLTDKRNDLQTIHRKKHTWEKITNDFNKKFSSLLRKRSIQQIQTWYKNEKARCRRVLIRQRLRHQTHATTNSNGSFELNFKDNSSILKLYKGNKQETNDRSTSSNPVETTSQNQNELDSVNLVNHETPKSSNTSPCISNLNNLSIPSLLALASKSDAVEAEKTSRTTTTPENHPTATSMSFLKNQANNSEDKPFIPFFPTEAMRTNGLDSKDFQNTLELPNAKLESPSLTMKPNAMCSPSIEGESMNHEPQEDSYERRLFERKMEILSVKEDCIRRYYYKKENVLKVKERYYQMKAQLLHDQVLSAQSNRRFGGKTLMSLPGESLHAN